MVDREFFSIVGDIVNHSKFLPTKNIPHHGGDNTLFSHSVNAAYMTYNIAKKLKWSKNDIISVTRAAMLHDFIEFKWNTEKGREYKKQFKGFSKITHMYAFIHGFQAVKYSSEFFDLSERQIDAMKKHMFPLVPIMPKYKETWLLICTDKIVAAREISETVIGMMKKSKYKKDSLLT